MITEKVRYGQTIFDICVWKYGTLNEISRLVRDNSSGYDISLLQGDDILINPDNAAGMYPVKLFFNRNSLIPTSGVDNLRIINNFVYADGNNLVFKDGNNFIFKENG